MEPLYSREFYINNASTDRFGRAKASYLLDILQEVAGDHSAILGTDREALTDRNLFWAVIRHRVQITRLPGPGETIRVETWPMPTTRTAYPRSTIAYDERGQEVFRAISLWVLMDRDTRAMVLPGRSGVEVTGTLRGCELAAPGSMVPREFAETELRRVHFSDLDINGHMNNCRYLDWVTDLLPSAFHQVHPLGEFTICYLSEIRENEELALSWELKDGRELTVEAHRKTPGAGDGKTRVFSGRMQYENVVL